MNGISSLFHGTGAGGGCRSRRGSTPGQLLPPRALPHFGKKQSREKHPVLPRHGFGRLWAEIIRSGGYGQKLSVWEVMDRNHRFGRLWTEIIISHAQGPEGSSFLVKPGGSAAPSPAAARPPAPARDAKEFKFKLILQIYLLCWRSAFPGAPEEKAPVVSSKTKVKGGAAARRGGKCRFLGAGGEPVPEGPSLRLGRVSSPLKAAASPLRTSIKPL